MTGMSRSDAELAYRYLRDGARGDVESEAYSKTLDQWQSDRPDDYETLEAAHDDSDSTFAWENIEFEARRDYDGDLAPLTRVDPEDEPEIRGLAWDFGADYLNAIRDEVRSMQETTDYSPREFVALVLDAAENTPEDFAHQLMDVSLGNYRGKKGKVAEKLERAEETVRVTDRIRA